MTMSKSKTISAYKAVLHSFPDLNRNLFYCPNLGVCGKLYEEPDIAYTDDDCDSWLLHVTCRKCNTKWSVCKTCDVCKTKMTTKASIHNHRYRCHKVFCNDRQPNIYTLIKKRAKISIDTIDDDTQSINSKKMKITEPTNDVDSVAYSEVDNDAFVSAMSNMNEYKQVTQDTDIGTLTEPTNDVPSISNQNLYNLVSQDTDTLNESNNLVPERLLIQLKNTSNFDNEKKDVKSDNEHCLTLADANIESTDVQNVVQNVLLELRKKAIELTNNLMMISTNDSKSVYNMIQVKKQNVDESNSKICKVNTKSACYYSFDINARGNQYLVGQAMGLSIEDALKLQRPEVEYQLKMARFVNSLKGQQKKGLQKF